jgi:hypothetical protein
MLFAFVVQDSKDKLIFANLIDQFLDQMRHRHIPDAGTRNEVLTGLRCGLDDDVGVHGKSYARVVSLGRKCPGDYPAAGPQAGFL